MPDLDLSMRAPLRDLARVGRFAGRAGSVGIVVEERTDLALASVIARRGKAGELAEIIAERYGLELPGGPRRATAGGISFAGVGVDRWLASAEGAPDFVPRLTAELTGVAAVADQSDARLVIRVRGDRVRDVLAKGVPLDLHPRAFRPGDVASTLVAHIGVQIQLLDDRPTFQLMAARSLAGSLWSWLIASAREFGYEVVSST